MGWLAWVGLVEGRAGRRRADRRRKEKEEMKKEKKKERRRKERVSSEGERTGRKKKKRKSQLDDIWIICEFLTSFRKTYLAFHLIEN